VVLLALLLLVAVALSSSACSALRAGRLLSDALQPPTDLGTRVTVEDVDVDTRAGGVTVVLARPADADGPLPAVVLVHGAVDAGARERRFMAFVRAFAARGMVVAAPDLRALASFHMDVQDPVRIADVATWLAQESGYAEDGHVAIAGVSVGGSMGLLAADDDAVRDDVSAVMAFGGYADLEALLQHWMTQDTEDHGELFDPLTEGRRMVLLGNVDHLVEPAHRDEVRRHLRALLDGTVVGGHPLPPDASEVVAVARSKDPLEPERARALLGRMRPVLTALSPSRAARPIAPVYLLHGASDPVVPVSDLDALATALEGRGVDVTAHVTELFDHVNAESSPGFFESWPLLRFIGAFLDDAGL
jgi:dienelactone hydrolase